MFCRSLNASVPHPKTYQENLNYRDAFKSMNTSTSVAIKSRHGIVELDQNGKWNPFLTKKLINGVCEKTLVTHVTKFARSKRQASSGNCRKSYSLLHFHIWRILNDKNSARILLAALFLLVVAIYITINYGR